MAKSKTVTVPDMIEASTDTPAAALAILRKHLKSGIGERYESRTNYLKVILDGNSKNVEIIAQAKETQWRVLNYAILLLIAVTGAVQLIRALLPGDIYKAVVGASAAVCIALIYYAARKMIAKISDDLAFYREHRRINEEMLNITVGIQTLANKVVSSRREALTSKHDFSFSAEENRLIFTKWVNHITTGSAVVALIVYELLVWTATKA